MPDRPHIVCLLQSSLDGSLHPSRWTQAAEGEDRSAQFEALHDRLGGDAWLVGRATMAEMAKGEPHPPADAPVPPRPLFRAPGAAAPFGVAFDTRGELHFREPDIGGDRVLVVLGAGVGDAHLAELVGDGVSYLVMDDGGMDGETIDPAAALRALRRDFGIERLLLEGGATVVGSFLAAGLVDELHLLLAPALDGRTDHDAIVNAGEEGLKGRIRLALKACKPLDGGTLHLSYDVRPA